MTNRIVSRITQHAAATTKRIVLPEASDPRVINAAARISELGYAHVVLLGDEKKIHRLGKNLDVDLANVEILNHWTDIHRKEYVNRLHQRRKHRGMTGSEAEELLRRPVYYGAMMVGASHADGMVAGSISPTRDTVRSALYGIGSAEGIKTIASCSLMLTIIREVGVDGALIFADTGVVPEPTTEQLADIAIAAAEACASLLQVEPCVAMLSFSSKGSARSPSVRKVIDATEMVHQRRPDLNIDGELQLDAAIVPEIARRKAQASPVAGHANTLVFPNLSAGNIGYKIVERLGRATAIGPILLGLAKPVNDLSRGCSIDDIVLCAAITAVQADSISG